MVCMWICIVSWMCFKIEICLVHGDQECNFLLNIPAVLSNTAYITIYKESYLTPLSILLGTHSAHIISFPVNLRVFNNVFQLNKIYTQFASLAHIISIPEGSIDSVLSLVQEQ